MLHNKHFVSGHVICHINEERDVIRDSDSADERGRGRGGGDRFRYIHLALRVVFGFY